jgi:hypothetical protein
MLHPATHRQFEVLKRRYADAALVDLPSGAGLLTIPEFKLPLGWSAHATSVRFIVPVGYPGPYPDCFWATSGLRLANGQSPHASQENNPIPETVQQGLWFSWHLVDAQANWNPNRDDLSTYVGVIAERFRKAQ